MAYSILVPPIYETQLTGHALTISDRIRGHDWSMRCDNAGRPLAITRNGNPYPTLPRLLNPMHRFARRFLGIKES